MAVIPVPRATSAFRIRWRTVMTVLAVAWVIAFVAIGAVMD
jgi:hypothetical protein